MSKLCMSGLPNLRELMAIDSDICRYKNDMHFLKMQNDIYLIDFNTYFSNSSLNHIWIKNDENLKWDKKLREK